MTYIDNLSLLHLFHQCNHQLHTNGKFHGQGRLLILLLEKGTLTQRELIHITARRSATLSEQLENMEKAGYISRTRNESDKRNIDVSLTASGREAAIKAQENRAERANKLFSQLDENDKEQLFQLLSKLLSSWEVSSEEGEDDKK